MSENIVAISAAILAFVFLAAILTLRSRKKYAEQWSGSVTEVRRYESGSNEGTPQSRVKLKWKRDNGSSGSLDLD